MYCGSRHKKPIPFSWQLDSRNRASGTLAMFKRGRNDSNAILPMVMKKLADLQKL